MATRADLNGILDQIQTTLVAANTVTASPIDLSSDLANSVRVKKVLTVHPKRIPPQASHFPFVTCYVKRKSPQNKTIAKDQLNAKRQAPIEIEIVGAVWNDRYTNFDKDPADRDIHYLMENVELILRSDPTLAGKVLWQSTDDVNYYDHSLDEKVHLRMGILSLKGVIFY